MKHLTDKLKSPMELQLQPKEKVLWNKDTNTNTKIKELKELKVEMENMEKINEYVKLQKKKSNMKF